MPTVGDDCDVTLQHPAVNGGAEVGFVLDRAKSHGFVKVKREAYQVQAGAWADRASYTLPLLVADSLTDPKGRQLSVTGAQLYAWLLQFLAQRTGIQLRHKRGVVTGLHASLDCAAEELSTGRVDVVTLKLNNGGWPETVPIDYAAFNASVWDAMAWDAGYWR